MDKFDAEKRSKELCKELKDAQSGWIYPEIYH